MPNSINEYFQPASTGVHNNIDNLILQAELDKLAQTGSMRADTKPQYIGGVDPIVENIALSPLLTLKSLGSVGKKLLEKTGLRNPVSHYTRGQNASNVLKQGRIKGLGQQAVSVTRDPMFTSRPHGSIGTDIRFILDRDELVRKGFSMKPIAVRGYGKTSSHKNKYDFPYDIQGKYPSQMNPRFEFEERVRGNIPTKNIKLIDILQLPLGESDLSPNMLKLLGQLSRTNIPIIKSSLVEKRLKDIPMSVKSEYPKYTYIVPNPAKDDILELLKTPTYKFDPFEKVR